MKLWNSYGSEHSMKLVMVGKFKTIQDAQKAKSIIDDFVTYAQGNVQPGDEVHEYSEGFRELMNKTHTYHIAPRELEQFVLDISIDHKQDAIRLETDEADVSAFLKLLVENGARVEVFSTHFQEDNSQT